MGQGSATKRARSNAKLYEALELQLSVHSGVWRPDAIVAD